MTTYTTAEGANISLRMNSSSLGISDQRWAIGPYVSSGPATNSSGQAMIQELIPLDIPCGGNEVVNFDTAPSGTSTVGASNMVSLLYTDGMSGIGGAAPITGSYAPPDDFLSKYPLPLPHKGGYVVDAAQLTTVRTALTAIVIPSWVKEIIGVKCMVLKAGAITAGQSDQAVIEFVSTIPNIAPLKIPTNSFGATLGTPVGTGLYHDQVPYLPVHIRGTGKNETITPIVNLVGAVSTGNRVIVGVIWR